MSNNLYKMYQLMEFFVTNYSYTNMFVKGALKKDEILLYNDNNTSYQLIKISSSNAYNDSETNETFDKFIDSFKHKRKSANYKLLDIHICEDTVLGDEIYDTACIDIDFHSGIDLNQIYPGIYSVIHEVDNQEVEINSRITSINKFIRKQIENAKKRPFFEKLKQAPNKVSLVLIAICVLLYLVSFGFSKNYSSSASLIFLGADYKMFTLGLGEYWRLITCAFLHTSLVHLACNMISLYYIGSILEPLLGKGKFILMLFCGVAIGSLTNGVLNTNTVCVGMSGGIYCLFMFFLVYIMNSGMVSLNRILPTVLMNIYINFLPNVSWQAHLGGAICGILFYYILQNDEIDYKILPVVFLLMIGLFVKYYKDFAIKPFYGGTDLEVVKIADDVGLHSYAKKTEDKLLEIYFNDKEN